METSLLSGNIAPEGEGVEMYLQAGYELVFVLPAPLGHYLDGVVLCKEQSCKENPTCQSGCAVTPCATQFCNVPAHGAAS